MFEFFHWYFVGLYVAFSILRLLHRINNRRRERASKAFSGKDVEQRSDAAIAGAHENPLLFWGRVLLVGLTVTAIIFYAFHQSQGYFLWMERFILQVPNFWKLSAWVLAVMALVGLHWTHVALGQNFSSRLKLQSGHELITAGPYAYVRHPMYSFLILYFIGSGVASNNVLILGCSLLLVLYFLIRIPMEERMLSQHFGQSYQAFMQNRKRIIPGLY